MGIATVGVFIYWYLYYDWAGDNHSLIGFGELAGWTECQSWKDFKPNSFADLNLEKDPCLYFTEGKKKASTLSLSVLVMIEMFNSLNAISDELSLVKTGIWLNPILLVAIMLSVILHCFVLYIPALQVLFSVAPLTAQDWLLVLGISFPVIVIDEILKFVTRRKNAVPEVRRQSKKSI